MRVALVHDWLTGMRGGEKVLEGLCELYPDADLFTLFHQPGSVSPLIERHRIQTSWLQRLPFASRHYRRFLPLLRRQGTANPARFRAFPLTPVALRA